LEKENEIRYERGMDVDTVAVVTILEVVVVLDVDETGGFVALVAVEVVRDEVKEVGCGDEVVVVFVGAKSTEHPAKVQQQTR
jgi:hypothetical protein